MLFSEIFNEFYLPTHYSLPAIYLYFGLKGHTALVPWIWTAIGINLIGTLTMAFNPGNKVRLDSAVQPFQIVFVSFLSADHPAHTAHRLAAIAEKVPVAHSLSILPELFHQQFVFLV